MIVELDQAVSAPAPASTPVRGSRVRFGLLLVAAIAAGIATYYYARGPDRPLYTTVRVDRGDIDSTVATSGSLNAVTTVQVGSQVSGNIVALYADFNTKVRKGQLVAQIDPAPFQAAFDQAAASLAALKSAALTAQANEAKAQADLAGAIAAVASQKAGLAKAESAAALAEVQSNRKKALVEAGIGTADDADVARAAWEQAVAGVAAAREAVNASEASSESARKQVDVAENQVAQAGAAVHQAEAVLAQARLNLDHTRILAPVDGTVESRNMDVGQTVAASFAAPVIFLIAEDLTRMQVDTNVDEADVGAIREGQPATFTVDAWPGQVFRGEVRQVRKAPINVQNVITYDVVLAVSNADLKLFPGMTANAVIQTGHAAGVVRIPKAALRFRPRNAAPVRGKKNEQSVYVLNAKGEPTAVKVGLGLSDANYSQLVSGGVREGDALITGVRAAPGTAAAPASQPRGGRLGF